MESPEQCPKQIYNIMLKTWDYNPLIRPNFLELMDELGDLLEEGDHQEYINLQESFDASTVQNPGYTGDSILGTMSPPDFQTQTSVLLAHVNEDEYLDPITNLNNGWANQKSADDYLVPNGTNHNMFELKPLIGNGKTHDSSVIN